MAYKNIEDKRKYDRELRAWWKAHRMCQGCGKKDAYTIAGRYYCYECTEYNRIRRSRVKIPRSQFEERGLCMACGKPAYKGFKVCELHYQQLSRARQIQKERRQDKTVRESITRQYKLTQGGL